MIFGIVVEAERDAEVYSTLIRKIRPDAEHVEKRPCGDVVQLRRKFVDWLKNFQWHLEYQVDKALVIRDSDCHDPRSVEDELARILVQSGCQPAFPVHFLATRRMVETWLLADEQAVNEVARRRGKTPSAQAVGDPLEEARKADDLFRRMLSQAHLPAFPAVYGEVAAAAEIDRIAQRCPYFQQFVHKVRAC